MPTQATRNCLRTLAATAAVFSLALVGCASPSGQTSSSPSESPAASADAQWPRTFTNADGSTTEIPAKPAAILSTSVSVTGTLLAIDAPVKASGSAGNGKFFAQWADVAQERGVENAWPATKVDLEAAHAAAPDLIVVSTSGADSLAEQVTELQDIAPTIVVDYGGQTWESLAAQLGEATGLEDEAAKTVEEFDTYVKEAASKIEVPAGSANVVSFNGPGEDNPIARSGSAQAGLLTELGFTLEEPDVAWHTQGNARNDFVWAAYENLTELKAETTFILSADNEGAKKFATDPVLANLPSIKNAQVYGLGVNSFRVDKYSATEIVDSVVENFAS